MSSLFERLRSARDVDGKSAIILNFRRLKFRDFVGKRSSGAFGRLFGRLGLRFRLLGFLNGLNPRTAKNETSEANSSSAVARRSETLSLRLSFSRRFDLERVRRLVERAGSRVDFRVLLLSSAFGTTRRDLIGPSISSAGFFCSCAPRSSRLERRSLPDLRFLRERRPRNGERARKKDRPPLRKKKEGVK